jgi:hypothetical protein
MSTPSKLLHSNTTRVHKLDGMETVTREFVWTATSLHIIIMGSSGGSLPVQKSSLTQVDESPPRLVRSSRTVLGEQFYNFLLLRATGYLRSGLSIKVTRLRIRTVVQQEPHGV